MDMSTVGTYADVPESLEKGCTEKHPLHSEGSHAESGLACRQSSFKRFWRAICAVALTWLAFSYGMRIFGRPHYGSWHWAGDGMRAPPPRDGDELECVGGANWTTYYDQPHWNPEYPYGAETSFSLPLDSDALYLLSRGPLQQGQVNIEQSTEVGDKVDVRVRVAYSNDKLLELASVCQLERAEREYGVGIFTPPWKRPYHVSADGLEFDVTLTLPLGNKGPLSVKKLETNMPNYSQNVSDLQSSVIFDEILLMSANGGLTVQSVTSEVGQFSLINGEIDGHFYSRSSLDLHTANGRITPVVNLLHREGAEASHLSIRTLNGVIDADVSLTSETSIGSEFEVDARSTNGEIGLAFTGSPVDSTLRCQVETIVGKVRVKLDRAFEGVYSLQSLLGNKFVSQHSVEDPAGKGRDRVITMNKGIGRVEGEIKWVEGDGSSPEKEGYVVLKTLSAPVELFV